MYGSFVGGDTTPRDSAMCEVKTSLIFAVHMTARLRRAV